MNENAGTPRQASLSLIAVALGTVYLVWGSTYLAIRFAIESLPPFLMAGIRFVIAGIVLYSIIRARGGPRPTGRNWKSAAIAGCLLLVGGNGLVSWSEQFVPSGMAAMMIATIPAWLVTVDRVFHNGPRLTGRIVTGLLAGLVGVFILLGPTELGGKGVHLWGGAALLAACVFWSFGSLYSRQADLPKSPFQSTAMEMLAGGVGLIMLATITGEWAKVDLGAVSIKSIIAVGYLVVFGSIVALSAYTWLLRVTTSARVSTYAYVNPVVAMFLGYAVADEPLSPRVLVASAIILGAVIIVTTARISPAGTKKQSASESSTVCQQTAAVAAVCPSSTDTVQAAQLFKIAPAEIGDVE